MKARSMRAVCFQTFVLQTALMCVLQFFDRGVVLCHSACLIVIRLDGPGCFAVWRFLDRPLLIHCRHHGSLVAKIHSGRVDLQ